MFFRYALLLSVGLFFLPIFIPFPSPPTEQEAAYLHCGSDILHQQRLRTDAAYAERVQKLEKEYAAAQRRGVAKTTTADYVLPVVFHIIHDNGPENLSDSLVQAGLQHLNQAFANTDYYDSNTGVNTRIQFCLAQRTPDEQPFDGITRTVSPLTHPNLGPDTVASVKQLISFDTRRYINVWVVREICFGSDGCNVVGYANYPALHGSPSDGIVMEARYLGGAPDESVVLVHEMGHYLGLAHTFNGGCINEDCLANGDFVCDTPPDNSTARPRCDSLLNSCTTDTLSGLPMDQPDMRNNYMDYSRFDCYNAFTAGQRDRMHFFLDGIRQSLITSLSCLPPCPEPVVADFSGAEPVIEVGTRLEFTNLSSNAVGYAWSIGDSLFSTATDTSFLFTKEGDFTVRLRAFSGDSAQCYNPVASRTIQVRCPFSGAFDLPKVAITTEDSVALTARDTLAEEYSWTINGQEHAAAATLRSGFPLPGTYTVCLTAGNAYCAAEQCRTFLVENGLDPAGACDPLFAFGYRSDGALRGNCVLQVGADRYLGGSYADTPLVIATDTMGAVQWSIRLIPIEFGVVTQLSRDEEGMLFGIGSSRATSRTFAFRIDPATGTLLWCQGLAVDLLFGIAEGPAAAYEIWGRQESTPNRPTHHFRQYLDRTTGAALTQPSVPTATGDIYYFDRARIGDRYYWAGLHFVNDSLGGRPTVRQNTVNGQGGWCRSYFHGFDTVAIGYSLDIEVDTAGFWLLSGGLSATDLFTPEVILSRHDTTGAIRDGWQLDFPVAVAPYRLLALPDRLVILARTEAGIPYLGSLDRAGQWQWGRYFSGTHIEGFPEYAEPNRALTIGDRHLLLAGTGQEEPTRLNLLRIGTDGRVAGDCPLGTEFTATVTPLTDLEAIDYTMDSLVTPTLAADSTQFATKPAPLIFTGVTCPIACPPELCGDGCDNDHDGLTDCADPDLQSDCCCYVPPPFELGPDRLIPNARGIDLAVPAGFREYRWEDGSSAPTRNIRTAGSYRLTAIDSCGTIHADTIHLEYDAAFFAQRLYLPTAFSPNGDNVNDYWRPYPGPDVARIALVQIFSRKGDLLYEYRDLDPQDPAAGWDGTADGRPLDTGVYVYQVVIQTHAGERIQRSGTILLHR